MVIDTVKENGNLLKRTGICIKDNILRIKNKALEDISGQMALHLKVASRQIKSKVYLII